MKTATLSIIILLLFGRCTGQEVKKISDLRFIGNSYQKTLNKSFINKSITFLKGKDTVIFNVKLPCNIRAKSIYDDGIFYNCVLKKDIVYSFELKKATIADIPKEYNSYYFSNAVFSTNNKSSFKEIEKDTKYLYRGSYGRYIDINKELYLIQKMTPTTDCVFQH